MRGDDCLELADEPVVAAPLQLAVDAVGEGSEPQLLESLGLVGRERFEDHVGEHRPTPERERRLEALDRRGGLARSPARASATSARSGLRRARRRRH